MQQFLSINPGLRSRIPALVEFPDYTDEELVTIAERITERRSLTLDPEAKTKIQAVMATERSAEGFGNAREVENLLDTAQRNIVARVSELGNLATSRESATVLSEDIPDATEPVVKRPFGFSSNSA
jgi:stage V sporulation protein K